MSWRAIAYLELLCLLPRDVRSRPNEGAPVALSAQLADALNGDGPSRVEVFLGPARPMRPVLGRELPGLDLCFSHGAVTASGRQLYSEDGEQEI